MNQAMIVGHVGQDPEVSYSNEGKAFCNFSVATNQSWIKDGEKQTKTEWHKVVAYANLAVVIGKYITKGSHILIIGRLQTRKWEDKKGVTRYTTEIVAREMEMLDKKGDREEQPTDHGPKDESLIPF